MFDLTIQGTSKSVWNWDRDLVLISGNIPVVACGNKVDVNGTEAKLVTFHEEHYAISQL